MFNDFERMFDSLFDDLLISRWREPVARDRQTKVIDHGDHYEVRLMNLGADPQELDIEASDRRLVVRGSGPSGNVERVVEFRHPVDAEAATAEASGDHLTVTLPKKRARKITVG